MSALVVAFSSTRALGAECTGSGAITDSSRGAEYEAVGFLLLDREDALQVSAVDGLFKYMLSQAFGDKAYPHRSRNLHHAPLRTWLRTTIDCGQPLGKTTSGGSRQERRATKPCTVACLPSLSIAEYPVAASEFDAAIQAIASITSVSTEMHDRARINPSAKGFSINFGSLISGYSKGCCDNAKPCVMGGASWPHRSGHGFWIPGLQDI